PGRQRVTVDGQAVRQGPVTWLALNKPVGYVVSRGDPEGRRTVYELLPQVPGLAYVGRLDVMTSGLLLLTTDGTAAHRLMHPRFAVPRTYWLRAHGHGATELRAALTHPPALDGRPVRVVDFRVRPVARSVEVELTLAEGRQRIVRRLAEALGLKVEWLHRVAYGPVRLGGETLPPLAAVGTVEWKIGATGLHWHGQQLLPRNTQIAELAGLLYARGVRTLTLNPGMTAEHVLALFQVATGTAAPDAPTLGRITLTLGRRSAARLERLRPPTPAEGVPAVAD